MNLLFVLLSFIFTAQAEVIDRIYATVNDEMITTSDIKGYEKQLKGRLLYEDLLFPDAESIDKAIKSNKFLVNKLIDEKILDSEAKKLGINITADRINKEIASKGGAERLRPLLRQRGLTLQDYKDFLEKSLARREVISYYVSSKIKISDDDVMDFYVSQHKGAQAGQGFEFNLSHLLFTFSGKEEKKEAYKKAQSALKALQEKSFSAVHSSHNPENKEASFGTFKSGEMLPVIESAIVPLKTGETSTIVESPLGYHIFKLNSKKVIDNPEFEREKKQIFQYLFSKHYKEQLDYFLHQKRRSAVIKINDKKKKTKKQ